HVWFSILLDHGEDLTSQPQYIIFKFLFKLLEVFNVDQHPVSFHGDGRFAVERHDLLVVEELVQTLVFKPVMEVPEELQGQIRIGAVMYYKTVYSVALIFYYRDVVHHLVRYRTFFNPL